MSETATATPGELQRQEREGRRRLGEIPPAPPGASDGPHLDGEAPEDQPDEVVQLSIEGDVDVKHTVGGHRPDSATLLIGGGSIKIRGSVKKGQRIRIVLEGPITGVHVDDLIDSKTGAIAQTKAKHVFKPDTVEREKVAGEGS